MIIVIAVIWPTPSAAPAVMTPSAPVTVTQSAGMPAVGALFSMNGARLGAHFCTASVVDSPAGDLLVTAAHCVAAYSGATPAGLAFAPGYDNGTAPYGVWTVTRIFVDSAWASTANPDDDVAFLAVAQPGRDIAIENVTGGERLGIGQPSSHVVRVTGYPDTKNRPISCQNRTSAFSSRQLRLDCDNYTNGTSGGPFLIDMDAATAEATVIGVIGGYQQGGDSADVSYSATFGPNVANLYDTAVSQG
jgi:V8-like Glu-specific endopeptidase